MVNEIEIQEAVKQRKKAADTVLLLLILQIPYVVSHSIEMLSMFILIGMLSIKFYSEGVSSREKLIVANDPSCNNALNRIRQSLKNIEEKMVSSKYPKHFEGIVRKRMQSVDRMSNTEIQSSTRKLLPSTTFLKFFKIYL